MDYEKANDIIKKVTGRLNEKLQEANDNPLLYLGRSDYSEKMLPIRTNNPQNKGLFELRLFQGKEDLETWRLRRWAISYEPGRTDTTYEQRRSDSGGAVDITFYPDIESYLERAHPDRVKKVKQDIQRMNNIISFDDPIFWFSGPNTEIYTNYVEKVFEAFDGFVEWLIQSRIEKKD